jgi:hypothetical protein
MQKIDGMHKAWWNSSFSVSLSAERPLRCVHFGASRICAFVRSFVRSNQDFLGSNGSLPPFPLKSASTETTATTAAAVFAGISHGIDDGVDSN